MKYYTKDWYVLMQQLNYTAGMQVIEDKKYTDAELTKLCSDRIKQEIEKDRKEYDTPPEKAEINFDEYDPEDFVTLDVKSGVLKKATSMEEVKKNFEDMYAESLEQFNSRPPFDPTDTIERFKMRYKSGLEYGYIPFPEWVKKAVDIRLIAMGYLPESVYKDLEAESQRNAQLFEAINSEAKRKLEKQDIPNEIAENFVLHDSEILAFEQVGGDIVMLIHEDCVPYEGQTAYTKVTFKDAEIVERDENLKFERRQIEVDGQSCDSYCVWLYEELYRTKDGYEAHILLSEDGLGYLTIVCKDICFDFNIEYSEEK